MEVDYSAEVFPTCFHAFTHSISAASGKAGAIISALTFNSLTNKISTPAVLWSMSGLFSSSFVLLIHTLMSSLCWLLHRRRSVLTAAA
jgi:PHS family inorganic phosphate transporter-like MFS transporter